MFLKPHPKLQKVYLPSVSNFTPNLATNIEKIRSKYAIIELIIPKRFLKLLKCGRKASDHECTLTAKCGILTTLLKLWQKASSKRLVTKRLYC